MSRFLIGIVQYGKNPHVRCFEDHARALAAALRRLGHEVKYASEEELARGGRLIMFGANNLVETTGERIPTDAIVFQTEQISAVTDPKYFLQNWLQYRDFTVWEYSRSNYKELLKLGIKGAILCPLGYVPEMTTIKPAKDRDIDVLFVGVRGGPRREILNALDKTNLTVVQLTNHYGAERDAYIARAKVVINLHYYQNGVFEIFRCAHLFANRICVVNEAGGRDFDLEALAERCTAYTPRAQLIERCRELAADAQKREEIAERAFEHFKKVDLVENVRRALEAEPKLREALGG